MQGQVVFRFLVVVVVIVIVISILAWNIQLQQKHAIDFDQYKIIVHNATKAGIDAEQLEPCLALARNASAQASIMAAVSIVGGHRELTLLSGYDTSRVLSCLVKQEENIRAVAKTKSIIQSDSFSEFKTANNYRFILPTDAGVDVNQPATTPPSPIPT